MRKYNNNQIEKIAVESIRHEVRYYERLDDDIKDEDKSPSIDGYIRVYSNNDFKKSNLVGRIPVQVKGTKVDRFSKFSKKRSINGADVINYYSDDGVIYFVVEIINNDVYKIFYKILLPVDLKRIIENNENSIVLYELKREEQFNLETVCFHFLENREKQKGKVDIRFKGEIGSLIFSVPRNIELFSAEFFSSSEIYIYESLEGLNTIIPIDNVANMDAFVYSNNKVFVGKKVYYDRIQKGRYKGEVCLKLGTTIILPFNKDNLSLDFFGATLNQIIFDLEFLKLVLKEKIFIIDSHICNLSAPSSTFKQLNEKLLRYKKVRALFYKLNVNEDIELSGLDIIESNKIQLLINGILDNKPLSDKEIKFLNIQSNTYKLVPFVLEVFTYKFMFILARENSGVKIYDYFQFFETGELRSYDEKGNWRRIDNKYFLSIFAHEFIGIKNFPNTFFQGILSESYDTKNDYTSAILGLLKAYDLSKNINYLDVAMEISCFILKYESDIFTKINHYQIIKRNRVLNSEEKNELYSLCKEIEERDIKCGCSILLDNYFDFERYFVSMEDYEQKKFLDFPICNLVPNEVMEKLRSR